MRTSSRGVFANGKDGVSTLFFYRSIGYGNNYVLFSLPLFFTDFFVSGSYCVMRWQDVITNFLSDRTVFQSLLWEGEDEQGRRVLSLIPCAKVVGSFFSLDPPRIFVHLR